MRTFSILFMLAVTLTLFPVNSAFAAEGCSLDLPPDIAAQAEPLLHAMMQQHDMSSQQMSMMMADMQTLADQLPPGIFLQLLQLMSQLDMAQMMTLHQQIQQGDLLQQPPGQILIFVQNLAQAS